MVRSSSRPALWPILLFFLIGAAAAILWDLRQHATPSQQIVSAPPARKAAVTRTPRERARNAAPVQPAAKHRESPAPESNRTPARVRKDDREFERVGIPSDRHENASEAPSPSLSEQQAERILRKVIESHGYYGLAPDCLWARPLGYREGGHDFEIVAADCKSIARGSVIGRWRVDATTGEPSYLTSKGTYEPAP